ncbi:RluA family pseudouridine synthase [Thalassotalea piscium]|uniref:tRNA pseudouridine32 synthase/23S rRNA pseudouridine746 synthase n=1 Tax=Thalassotalea piscium TaxID=1230533 RepID=A0A7X0NH26_9GAMM|nr:RNA pseudouridine synthase [Thalassotalea piscium]MBB6543341.1 tRNA pseudouridine32 synthase/23S rRNA pseudouridine746 synthase [Thalassotalea piscium]
MTIIEKHIVIEQQKSVIQAIEQVCQLSHQQIKIAINKGALWLSRGKYTQRLRRIKKTLLQGDTLHFYYNETVLAQVPNQAELIEDCLHYSVWYKPYGMLSQGSKWSDHCTITRWSETHLLPERPAFIVHRLDRAATGLILVAHSKTAAQALTKLFEARALQKQYHIICLGKLDSESVITVTEPIDNKAAKSHFKSLYYDKEKDLSLVEVTIETGRKHQIRKHAAYLDHPVYGDRLYNKVQVNITTAKNLQLSAAKLNFTCPITAEKKRFILPDHLMLSINE